MSEYNPVLVLYDVRGIQDYIFRTTKMRDAIGASCIVENLFEEAIGHAVKKLKLNGSLEWTNEHGPCRYREDLEADLSVLYIGGGNACVICRTRDTAVAISREMARYALSRTYSLQLATAIVKKTENYSEDYANLMREMARIKDGMVVSKPLDALPVVKAEAKTGFPLVQRDVSTESKLKTEARNRSRNRRADRERMILDNYISEKGESSMLAVVHIDGNNMGQRIRSLLQDKTEYGEAVNEMRRISSAINGSYKKVCGQTAEMFNSLMEKGLSGRKKYGVMEVISAGDDITYVCNAEIAFATVEYFCKNISKYGMLDGNEGEQKYRFSVCAGIAFFHSHFPFNIAYNVAEGCCESAKKCAKKEQYLSNYNSGTHRANATEPLVGNWFDFQFCRSVHSANLDKIREDEYRTMSGEKLLRRPYFIPCADLETGNERFKEMRGIKGISYDSFKDDMRKYVQNERIPRSIAKEIRDTYPLGENRMRILKAFLESRDTKKGDNEDGRKYPEDFYFTDEDGKTRIALLYDALEVADYYRDYNESVKEGDR